MPSLWGRQRGKVHTWSDCDPATCSHAVDEEAEKVRWEPESTIAIKA